MLIIYELVNQKSLFAGFVIVIIHKYNLRVQLCLSSRHKFVIVSETKGGSILLIFFFRISFCTADRNHDKVFAFIARNTINETMECHAYLCAKAKIVSCGQKLLYSAVLYLFQCQYVKPKIKW